MHYSEKYSGFHEEYLPSEHGQAKVFHAPKSQYLDPGDPHAYDVHITVLQGPLHEGKAIDPDMQEHTVEIKIAPSQVTHTESSGVHFVVRGCTLDYAHIIRVVCENTDNLAPTNLYAAIETVLREGKYEYANDPGQSGIIFHETRDAIIKEIPRTVLTLGNSG